MTHSVQVDVPLNAAAYQVLYELTFPANCTTREQQKEILAEFDRVLEWAKSQPEDICKAYEWAAAEIAQTIESTLIRSEFNRQVNAAVASIPRPPQGTST